MPFQAPGSTATHAGPDVAGDPESDDCAAAVGERHLNMT